MAPLLLHYAQKMLDWRLRHGDRTLTNMSPRRGRRFRADLTYETTAPSGQRQFAPSEIARRLLDAPSET